MMNSVTDNRIGSELFGGIEDALDSANFLSFDLAISAFDNMEELPDTDDADGRAFKIAAERSLHATGMISRVLSDSRI